ncbi:MAG TPA: HDOD domain-containing protein [Methylibium sp.]|nr:HDOD domain-containing protein [Methylibium sp.]
MTAAATTSSTAASATRRLGRFELRQLLGKSSASMLWLAHDPQRGAELHLLMPRQQPADVEAWLRHARHAARLQHPQVAAVVEVGVEDRWPYVASARVQGLTLEEHLAAIEPPGPQQGAQWLCELLQGLAFLHEGGALHGDIGLHTVLIDPQGRALLLPLGGEGADGGEGTAGSGALAVDPGALRSLRAAGERDVLAAGLLLHRLLTGAPALDEKDFPTALQRLDREIVRLGWSVPQPIPDALRAIANRAVEHEPQRRYLSARSLQRALQGWIDAQAEGGDGVLALLLDRLHRIGHLPALPGLLSQLAAVVAMEQQKLDEVTEVIVQDPALAFELLRQVNTAQFGTTGEAAVTTVRRAVQLIGLLNLRRTASTLKPWPGPLAPAAAGALAEELRRAKIAAHAARILCPADMDGEIAYLVGLLQHLGPLLMRYHFPDEAEQIRRLVDPEPGVRAMDEVAAACAVIGVEVESLAIAVARHWGLDDAMLHAMRRVPATAPVRHPDTRNDTLRLLASAAAEAVAAAHGRGNGAPQALARVTQRYARALVLGPNELANAVQSARIAVDRAPRPLQPAA